MDDGWTPTYKYRTSPPPREGGNHFASSVGYPPHRSVESGHAGEQAREQRPPPSTRLYPLTWGDTNPLHISPGQQLGHPSSSRPRQARVLCRTGQTGSWTGISPPNRTLLCFRRSPDHIRWQTLILTPTQASTKGGGWVPFVNSRYSIPTLRLGIGARRRVKKDLRSRPSDRICRLNWDDANRLHISPGQQLGYPSRRKQAATKSHPTYRLPLDCAILDSQPQGGHP